MKPVNFIATLPAHEQHALQRWYHWSLCLVGFFLLSIFFIEWYQITTLSTAYKTHTNAQKKYAHLHNNQSYQSLVKEHESLQHQFDQAQSIGAHQASPLPYLNAIQCNLSKGAVLLESSFTHSECLITIQINVPAQALIFIKELLQHNLFSNLKLVSLEPGNSKQKNCFIAHIKGALKTQ